jgi:hypothetical protein
VVWVKLDDGFVRHPRMVAAGLHGRALFIAGLCYCGAHLTDGRIPKAAIPMLVAEAGVKAATWRTLIDVGSWIDHGDHIEVHDFLVYNPSREAVLFERSRNARRQALQRDPELRECVRSRDRDLCRYCGEQVKWRDRRGPRSGTYDHVEPNGPNTADNLVIACRACNAMKKDRTPEAAGMVLLNPGTRLVPGDAPETNRGSATAPDPARPVLDVPKEREPNACASIDVDFESWWAGYPRKIAKQHAMKAYRSASKHTTPEQLMAGLEASKCAWARERRPIDKIPHAATWLNGHRWADDHGLTANGSSLVGSGPVTATVVELPA